MINALHSSRNGGTKNFMLNGNYFGWKTIINMYERECNRVSNGIARMVPKLWETHIIRDSWTKLNVSPAKIMQVRKIFLNYIYDFYLQQEQVMGELFHHISQNPTDILETKTTLKYLESCHSIFEKGFLSHDRIFSMDAGIITSINKGYSFFTQWHSSLINKGKCLSAYHSMLHTLNCLHLMIDGSIPVTHFLAWQSEYCYIYLKNKLTFYSLGSA